jgi:hypothetical protein
MSWQPCRCCVETAPAKGLRPLGKNAQEQPELGHRSP